MTKKKNQNVLYTQAQIIYMGMRQFDQNKYTSNSSKGCLLEIELEYSRELHKLHNDYTFTPGKIEIKKNIVQLSTKDCRFS